MAPMEVIPVTEQNPGSAFSELWARSFLQMPLHRALAVGHFFCSLWDLAGLFWEGCSLCAWFGSHCHPKPLWLTWKESREAGPYGDTWAMSWPVQRV